MHMSGTHNITSLKTAHHQTHGRTSLCDIIGHIRNRKIQTHFKLIDNHTILVMVCPQIRFLGHPGLICYFSHFALLLIVGALLSMRPVATHCSDNLDRSSKDPCESRTGNFDQTVMHSLHHLVPRGFDFLLVCSIDTLFKTNNGSCALLTCRKLWNLLAFNCIV